MVLKEPIKNSIQIHKLKISSIHILRNLISIDYRRRVFIPLTKTHNLFEREKDQ